MSKVVLSIGSNLGNRAGNLQSVVSDIGSRVRAVSSVYRTAPWGGVPQEDFFNAVLIADDPRRNAVDWLHHALHLEQRTGRVREVRWGPRSLDVDIVTCDDIISDDPELTLPHPRARQRAFVLVPWLEIDPDAQLPIGDRPHPVADLVTELGPGQLQSVHRCTRVALRLYEGDT